MDAVDLFHGGDTELQFPVISLGKMPVAPTARGEWPRGSLGGGLAGLQLWLGPMQRHYWLLSEAPGHSFLWTL